MDDKKLKKERFLQNTPDWVIDYNAIDEVAFCRTFTEHFPLKCVGGRFITLDGEITGEKLNNLVSREVMRYMRSGISKKVKSIIEALRLYCYTDEPLICADEIHLLNGVLKTDGTWIPERRFCINRLNIRYETSIRQSAYFPERFLGFLLDLLAPEDVITLQEYLGYCLIPSNKGQKALFLIGSGGEGKSRIGVVLQEIFGISMITGSFQRIETDRFFSLQSAKQAAAD